MWLVSSFGQLIYIVLLQDCFERPICSAPDAWFDVVKRVTNDNNKILKWLSINHFNSSFTICTCSDWCKDSLNYGLYDMYLGVTILYFFFFSIKRNANYAGGRKMFQGALTWDHIIILVLLHLMNIVHLA